MTIYLVQHGEALPKQSDPDRRLSDQGRRDVERISAYLQKTGISVKRVYHSGKTRAVETACIFAGQIGDGSISELPGMAPDDDVKKFARILKEDDTMYVGHLPHLERLVSYLVTGNEDADVVRLTNGGVLCIKKGDIGYHIEWYLRPSMCNSY